MLWSTARAEGTRTATTAFPHCLPQSPVTTVNTTLQATVLSPSGFWRKNDYNMSFPLFLQEAEQAAVTNWPEMDDFRDCP